MNSPLFVGIDVGTSGCRAVAIDARGQTLASAATALPAPLGSGNGIEQDPSLWWEALQATLAQLLGQIDRAAVRALALDGTSGTVLLADAAGQPLGPALMYNDQRASAEAQAIAVAAPADSAAHGPGSGLARLLWLQARPEAAGAARFLHQCDWLSGMLTGRFDVSDENNALKSGYDPVHRCWPEWLDDLGLRRAWLPRVVAAGTPLAHLQAARADALGLRRDTLVVAGTTDSTAAFLATGAAQPGEAVTSLGSTLVLKVLATSPVVAPDYGVYAQPLRSRGRALWLVGGASNSGGAVLRRYFSDAAMAALTPQLQAERPTGLDYYPLTEPGERFPISDAQLAPRVTPRPDDDARFFQGLLEGIAEIEYTGYRRLAELGAPFPASVRTVGGGSVNPAWRTIRARRLGVPLLAPEHAEAACGAALLARRGFRRRRQSA